jgi:hypothetical protein
VILRLSCTLAILGLPTAWNELTEEEIADVENPFWNHCKEYIFDTLLLDVLIELAGS